MTGRELEAERVAICVEAGVPEGRAAEIAACERDRYTRALAGLPVWCDCRAHETAPRRHEDAT